ncbi:MAG: S1C family serine protease [Oscillospiraceae bacterium]|nr:S1C family serine protease [Oscillospiraceae bacterium]
MDDRNDMYPQNNEQSTEQNTAQADGAYTSLQPVYKPVDPIYVAPGASYRPPEAAQQQPQDPPQNPPARHMKREKKPRRPLGAGAIAAICIVCALVAGLFGSGITYFVTGGSDETAIAESAEDSSGSSIVSSSSSTLELTSVSSSSTSVSTATAVYELATQQVVGITTEITYNVFGQATSTSVSGSGFIISEDGYIMTNYHVIEDAYEGGYEITVMMYDETEYVAEIVGFDEDSDIAVLKIDATGLNAAELGDSDELVVGQEIYAVGNPLGELTYTMTSGIVSATNRTITTEEGVAMNMFQIDAAVNSGNSGGPVYNTSGQVIGIVTAKYSDTGVEGLGFAIPINEAIHIANQILTYGYVTDKAYMGVSARTVTATIAEYYGMVEGAYIETVNEGSAAETAGLESGDIITAIDNTTISSASDLTNAVKGYRAGDTAELTVFRDDEYITLTITFDEKLPDEETEEEEDTDTSASGEMQGGQSSQGGMSQFFGYGIY